MKRSQIVKLIENSISVYLEECHIKNSSAIADTVLANMEKSGMLPPNDWQHGVPLTYKKMLEMHSWEEEGE